MDFHRSGYERMNAMNNTQIVKNMYEAFGRGDIATILGGLADNVEWMEHGPESIPTAGTYRRPGEVADFFKKVADNIEFEPFAIDEYVEQGDIVVVLGSLQGPQQDLAKTLSQ
jgi:uncharacterized protein